jgi:hypothetical protein
MSARGLPRDYKKIVKPLLKDGWTLTGGGKRHFRVHPPAGDHEVHPLSFPSTPGAHSGLANFKAAVKRSVRLIQASQLGESGERESAPERPYSDS